MNKSAELAIAYAASNGVAPMAFTKQKAQVGHLIQSKPQLTFTASSLIMNSVGTR